MNQPGRIQNFIFLFIILAGCGQGVKHESSTPAGELDIARIKLTELNGQVIDLSQFEGKTVFINVWATWCKPCIQEMPTIQHVQDSLKDCNIVFLMASNEEPEEIDAFAKIRDFQFHYVRLSNLEALNIQALPTTMIFDSQGKLKFNETGFRQWDDAQNISLIKSMMKNHEE
jgi:thiol-disulfide isomerase/thioredoxin